MVSRYAKSRRGLSQLKALPSPRRGVVHLDVLPADAPLEGAGILPNVVKQPRQLRQFFRSKGRGEAGAEFGYVPAMFQDALFPAILRAMCKIHVSPSFNFDDV